MSNKDLKKQVKAEFLADKEKRKTRQQELAARSAEEHKSDV